MPSRRREKFCQTLNCEWNSDEGLQLLEHLALDGFEVERVDVRHRRNFGSWRTGKLKLKLLKTLTCNLKSSFEIIKRTNVKRLGRYFRNKLRSINSGDQRSQLEVSSEQIMKMEVSFVGINKKKQIFNALDRKPLWKNDSNIQSFNKANLFTLPIVK